MKRATALWLLTALAVLSTGGTGAEIVNRFGRHPRISVVGRLHASPQAAKSPQWKSREEYETFDAIASEFGKHAYSDAEKIASLQQTISLAEAFLRRFPESDFKAGAYVYEMHAYAWLGKMDQAVRAGRNAQSIDPDNLEVLTFLSGAFPEVFRADDPFAVLKLKRAETDAAHGLDVLQTIKKPASATDAQFDFCLKGSRAFFNGTIGFAALERRDYAAAAMALTAASANDPNNVQEFYRLARIYIYSAQPDFDYGIWFAARAEALARASAHISQDHMQEYLRELYVNYHGNEEGLEQIVDQASKAVLPPDGFKVSRRQTPGNISGPATPAPPYVVDQACSLWVVPE